MTSLPGHFRSPEVTDVISCHVTASSCKLQPCRKSNTQYTPVFFLLQPLQGDFRWNDFTYESLRSPEVTAYARFWPSTHTSKWLPVKWRHFWVTFGHLHLREVKRTVYASFRPSTATFRWLPLKWRHFRMTSCHLRSHDIISCHVTASCELQPSRKSNAQYTQVFVLLHSFPGDFRSNDVTSRSLRVTWGHVTSFPVTWLPPPVSYSLVGSQTHRIRQFSVF